MELDPKKKWKDYWNLRKDWISLILDALDELYIAVSELDSDSIFLKSRMPHRPRFFHFTPSVKWPGIDEDGKVKWRYIEAEKELLFIGSRITEREETAWKIFYTLNDNPRHLLHALRQIRTATEWCRRRREGQIREAEEIIKQRKKYYDAVLAEIAMRELKK